METYQEVMSRLIRLAIEHRRLPMHMKRYSMNKRNRPVDMTGKKFNRLTVIAIAGRCWRQLTWLCICDCGRNTVVRGAELRSGGTKSCGCYKNEVSGRRCAYMRSRRFQSGHAEETQPMGHSVMNDLMRSFWARPSNHSGEVDG